MRLRSDPWLTAIRPVNDLDLSVVVPVYNNAATLDALIDRLGRVLGDLRLRYELIFVDDGSTDETFAILVRHANSDVRVRAHRLTHNFGSQAAICAGFDLVRGQRTICMDADLENLPEDIPPLLAALDRGADLACGVREDRPGSWLRRRLPSRLINAYVRHRVGTAVRDIGCGMRAMESRVVHNLGAEGEGRRLITPLLLKRATAIVEVPIRTVTSSGASGHSFLTLLGIAADFYLLTARRPFLIGGLIAAGGASLGAALLLAGALLGSSVVALVGVMLTCMGFLGSLIALAGEYTQRLYQLAQGRPFYELQKNPAVESSAPREAG